MKLPLYETLPKVFDNEQQLLRVLLDVLMGLEAIHKADYVHLDIKPQNILLSEDGVVLYDLGLALPVDQRGKIRLFGVRGTRKFMSPEILKCNPSKKLFAFASDVYSLAITMRELAKRYSGSISRRFKQLVEKMSVEDAELRPLPAELLKNRIFRFI
jgi:serine/threonine protein kinase